MRLRTSCQVGLNRIGGFLGSSDTFDRAIADFASTHADQNDRDYHRVKNANSVDTPDAANSLASASSRWAQPGP